MVRLKACALLFMELRAFLYHDSMLILNFFVLCLVALDLLIVLLLRFFCGLFSCVVSWGMDSEMVLLCRISPSVVSCVLIILAPKGMSSIDLSCSVVGVVLQIKVVLHLQVHLAV